MSAVKRRAAKLAARRRAWDKRYAGTLQELLRKIMSDENLRDHLFVVMGNAWIRRVNTTLDTRP